MVANCQISEKKRLMPIERMLKDAGFAPDAVMALTAAYDDIVTSLCAVSGDLRPSPEAVARKLIEHAQPGGQDYIKLRNRVLADLENAAVRLRR